MPSPSGSCHFEPKGSRSPRGPLWDQMVQQVSRQGRAGAQGHRGAQSQWSRTRSEGLGPARGTQSPTLPQISIPLALLPPLRHSRARATFPEQEGLERQQLCPLAPALPTHEPAQDPEEDRDPNTAPLRSTGGRGRWEYQESGTILRHLLQHLERDPFLSSGSEGQGRDVGAC